MVFLMLFTHTFCYTHVDNLLKGPAEVKNTTVVLVSCLHMEVHPYRCFQWYGYFQGPWVSFVMPDEFSVRVTKITSRIGVLWTCSLPFYLSPILTQWFMVILSKGYKPDNFKSRNSLKLSFTNIWGLPSNFADCESFLQSNSLEILALCETNLDDLIDFVNFSVGSYLPLIQKDSTAYMHGLAIYVKEGLPLAWDLSLENSADS